MCFVLGAARHLSPSCASYFQLGSFSSCFVSKSFRNRHVIRGLPSYFRFSFVVTEHCSEKSATSSCCEPEVGNAQPTASVPGSALHACCVRCGRGFCRFDDIGRYVRVLGAFYLRLVGTPADIYQYLEPLYNDYRKIKMRLMQGEHFMHGQELHIQ